MYSIDQWVEKVVNVVNAYVALFLQLKFLHIIYGFWN